MAEDSITLDELAAMVQCGFQDQGERSNRVERKLDAVIEVVKRHDKDIKRLKRHVGI